MLMDSDSIKAPPVTKTMPHTAPCAIRAKQRAAGATTVGKKGRGPDEPLWRRNSYFLSFAIVHRILEGSNCSMHKWCLRSGPPTPAPCVRPALLPWLAAS